MRCREFDIKNKRIDYNSNGRDEPRIEAPFTSEFGPRAKGNHEGKGADFSPIEAG